MTNARIRRATVALLIVLAGVLGTSEFASRFLFPRISRIQRRIVGDEREAKALGAPVQNSPATLLVVGNSLVLYALDYPAFISALAPDVRPVRYAIENTSYLDWYYGLKALFSEGVRPSRVVVCMNLAQILERGVLGEYTARHLFRGQDLVAVGRDAGLDNTKISGLFFAHWSAFYADRAQIRNYILNVSDPSYAEAMNALARVPPPFPPDDEALRQTRLRLRAMMKLCQEYHVDFVFVVPPSLKLRDEMLARAGTLENVPVDIPVPLGSLSPKYFLDGFHLNPKGAELFTDALARDLKTGRAGEPAAKGTDSHITDSGQSMKEKLQQHSTDSCSRGAAAVRTCWNWPSGFGSARKASVFVAARLHADVIRVLELSKYATCAGVCRSPTGLSPDATLANNRDCSSRLLSRQRKHTQELSVH